MTCDLHPGSSFLHQLDPRLKIVIVLVWSFLSALIQALPAASFALAGSLLFALTGRLSPRATLARLVKVNAFLLIIWLLIPFSFSLPGRPVGGFGFFTITAEGLQLALLLTLKANAVALGALAFFGTSSVTQLAAAARRLGASEKITTIFLLMLRYFHVIRHEYARLCLAMKARAFRPTFSLHTYRSYANLVGMLMVRSMDRAGRVHAAMLCRGYTGRFWFYDHFSFTRLDLAGAVLAISLVAGVLVLNVI